MMLDIPHLIKSTRNIIYNGNSISTHNGNVSWFRKNKNKRHNLIRKPTETLINLPKYGGKMKVRYATQILSHSMSVAMKTLITEQLLINQDAAATQIFYEKMNCQFDILNSIRNPNPNKKIFDQSDLFHILP